MNLLNDLKAIESQEDSPSTLVEDIEASIRYLSNSKLKSLINKQQGLQSFQFFIPLQGLPSVEVKINELNEIFRKSVKDEPTPSSMQSQSSFTYEDPRLMTTERAQHADSFGRESDGALKGEADQAENGENNEQESSDSLSANCMMWSTQPARPSEPENHLFTAASCEPAVPAAFTPGGVGSCRTCSRAQA